MQALKTTLKAAPFLALVCVCLLPGCGSDTEGHWQEGDGATGDRADGGRDVGADTALDAASADAGLFDASHDAASLDTGSQDAGAIDASADSGPDGGVAPDAGPADAGEDVGAAWDAGVVEDAGTVEDAGADAGGDAGIVLDSGVSEDGGASDDAAEDAGFVEDSGVVEDAGIVEDSGNIKDVGVDAGEMADAGEDAGLEVDAGVVEDSGVVEDAGAEIDAGVSEDADWDAGVIEDSGVAEDAGWDAGWDAGHDAGYDAGHDAGVPDSGPPDAGESDAGVDAGYDAGYDAEMADAGADSGTVADAGADAGPADAGWDAGVEEDAGVDPCADTPCAAFDSAYTAGTVAEPLLTELSGLAASHDHPGVLYAHNDSGDSARFFAMSDTGAALGEFRLQGATARDWEDMALGPCPAGWCVYIGDFGDNSTVRTDYAIYRVAEPDVEVGSPVGVVNVTYERFPFQYPNGTKYNCETLLVHPESGDIYVVTKMPGGQHSDVYKFPQPLDSGTQVTLIKVADLAVPTPSDSQMTGGDIHPCGTGVLLRMYNRCVLFRLPEASPFDDVFTESYEQVPCASEGQGEAAAWSADGLSYFTASEGSHPALHRVDCQ